LILFLNNELALKILIEVIEKTSPQLTADGQISLRSICPKGHSEGANPRPFCVSGDVFSS